MDINRVIYFNELSDHVEQCFRSEVSNGNSLKIKGQEFTTSMIARRVYIDGKYIYNSYAKATGKAIEFINGIPRIKKGQLIGQLIFELVHKSPKQLIVEVSEWCELEEYKTLIARIEFKIQPNITIQSISGDALIRIYDVDVGCLSISTGQSLGEFALYVGLYFFIDLDGHWDSLNNEGTFIDITLNRQTKILLDHQDISSQKMLSAQKNTATLLNQRFDKIDESLSSIQYEIQELQSRLKLYKEDLLERLKPNLDGSLAESYINEFMDTISVRIVKSISKELSNSDYLEEETYLKYIFKYSWDKLSEKSKSFLITARVMFKNLNKSNVEVDYSGVCILLSKSVEVELKRRLYNNFQDYLQEHYGEDYNQWHTVMVESVNGVITPLRESRFTLGTIPYLLGLIKIKGLDEYHLNQNKTLLSEFGSKELTVSTDEIESSFRDIAKHIKHITDTYRNPAAHTNILSRSLAQECFDEIVDIQRILILILRYFKY